MSELIGKRVRLTVNNPTFNGMVGILKAKDNSSYAFEADIEHEALHDCRGRTHERRGHWVWEGDFELIEDEPNEFCGIYTCEDLSASAVANKSIAKQTTCKSEHYDEHYASSAIQPIQYMVANFTHEEMVGFLKGNIIKYISRMGKKDDPTKETAKIKRYSEWLKEYEATGTITI